MTRWAQRIGIGLAVVAGLLTVGAGVLYAMSAVRLGRKYEVPAAALEVRGDAETVARGRHIANHVALCVDCHGGDLAGKVLLDQPTVGRLVAPNLTPAGRAATFSDADWDRAIRHGVGPDGKPLVVMPSADYANLADGDAAALIAYLKQLAPVERTQSGTKVGPLARFGLVTNRMPLLPAESLDHGWPRPERPAPAATAEYGQYLASIACAGCHGPQLKGKQDAWHDTPDITPMGRTAGWTRAQFMTALRTGRRPDGTTIAPERMPWPLVGQMTDLELSAIFAYVQQLDRRVALQDVPR